MVTVADSGFSSEADLAYLTRADGHCITGVKIRETNKKAATALAGRAATRTCATTSGSTDHPHESADYVCLPTDEVGFHRP
ncbi:hypothetical protein DKG34_37895 [Streptomyces sp. NWU49]|nr:hypothetical protein DKG34_37895 [Streptomyces sp. NWU49]